MHRRGFHATSLEDVMDELAITRPAFYYYLADKEELLYRILKQTLDLVTERVSTIARSTRTPDEKIRAIIDLYVTDVTTRPEFFMVYFRDRHHLTPEHVREITKLERALVDTISGAMREGMRRGQFRRTDPTVLTFGLTGMCLWISLWYRRNGRLSVEQISSGLQSLARDGYITPRQAHVRATKAARR